MKLTLLLCSMLTILAGAIIAPALPVIEDVFDQGGDQTFYVALLLTTTSLCVALSAPLSGYLVDHIGRRKTLLTALFFYGLFGSAGAYLNSLETLLISRILLGVSVSGIVTSTFTLTGDYFEGEERERFFGYQSAFVALGGFFFLGTSGYLASYSWHAPFFLYTLSWLFFLLAWKFIHEPGELSSRVLPSEARGFDSTAYLGILTATFLGMTFYFVVPTQLPFTLYETHKMAPHETGLLLGTSTLCAALSSSLYGLFRDSVRKIYIYAIAFCIMGCALMALSSAKDTFSIGASLISLGFGFGMIVPNSTTWTTLLAPEALRGRLIGFLSSSLFVAQFVATLFGEAIGGSFLVVGILSIGVSSAITIHALRRTP